MLIIDKKALIDEAAYEVFKSLGFKKTNISAITKKAGIATGSFYNYYASKEEIFLKIYIQENNKIREFVKQNVDWDADPIEIIQQLFAILVQAQKDNNIMKEWENNDINYLMKDYYNSEEGKNEYQFHHFLLQKFQEKLNDMNISKDEITKILSTYELIYSIDTKLDHSGIHNFVESYQYLIENFIKGIFLSRE
ncbi:TetR/AcrR family transcriptional regulator [Macrococcus animalis]|uniref:TetR/AcrR family transcriptional regulator n=1 Tax=Macrococcus animalis TaxID=3395467 RepID=UPI0039BE0A0F